MPTRIKPIVSKELLANAPKLIKALDNALKGVTLATKADFGVTTQTWKRQPEFKIEIDGVRGAKVYTTDQIYQWINDGTKPYVIRPKRARMLRFGTPFRAKTSPGAIKSRAGSRGRNIVMAKVVHHPGITAREFDEVVQEKWQKEFPDIVQRSLDSALD